MCISRKGNQSGSKSDEQSQVQEQVKGPVHEKVKTEPKPETEEEKREREEKRKQMKQIVNFVRKTLEKMPNGLRAEFGGIKRTRDLEKMKEYVKAQDLGRNRYKDVGCLDSSRVILGEPWPHDYIHANYVSTPSNPKRFICTQAPMEKTCADFWFMCLQEKVEVIVMVCSIVEKGSKRCHEYFPTKELDTLEFEEGEKKIKVKFESKKKFQFKEKHTMSKIFETVVSIEGLDGSTSKITHYHFADWGMYHAPHDDFAILELLDAIRVSKNPIVVHGAAGIGRTGTLVLIEYIMDQFLAGQVIDDVEKILIKIREQRNNSVQSDEQYMFVHQILLKYFEKKKLMDNEGIENALAHFKAEYKRLTG